MAAWAEQFGGTVIAEPGGGKPSALSLIVAHGALSGDFRLILIDGKHEHFGWK
jgi:hypothetical protein